MQFYTGTNLSLFRKYLEISIKKFSFASLVNLFLKLIAAVFDRFKTVSLFMKNKMQTF